MRGKIDYSFALSTSVCEQLDEIAFSIGQNAATAQREHPALLSEAWSSEASELLAQKYSSFLDKQREISAEIEHLSETIKKISRRLYLAEEAAKKTAEVQNHS